MPRPQLPDLEWRPDDYPADETSIALVQRPGIASYTGDLSFWVHAYRRRGGWIYAVGDAWTDGDPVSSNPSRSRRPLTLGELVHLIEAAGVGEGVQPGLAAFYLDQVRDEYGRDLTAREMRREVDVSSGVYPGLAEWWRYRTWELGEAAQRERQRRRRAADRTLRASLRAEHGTLDALERRDDPLGCGHRKVLELRESVPLSMGVTRRGWYCFECGRWREETYRGQVVRPERQGSYWPADAPAAWRSLRLLGWPKPPSPRTGGDRGLASL